MTEPDIERVETILVVGSGAMGSQIAMVGALADYRVAVQDIDGAMLERAQNELRSRMARNVEKGRMAAEDVGAALGRMTLTTDVEHAAASADFVIEAAVEKARRQARPLRAPRQSRS